MALKDSSARKFDLEVVGSARDLGELQYNVLLGISEKRYSDAIESLRKYKTAKAGYPHYVARTEQIFKHAEDLINAIEAKKNFPNIHMLPQSKQEEIHQKAIENWEALKVALRRLKSMERDMAAADARSSIWVIKAMVLSACALLFLFILNEAFRSFGKSFPGAVDELVQTINSFISG